MSSRKRAATQQSATKEEEEEEETKPFVLIEKMLSFFSNFDFGDSGVVNASCVVGVLVS